ncbi:unnamed protein product [Cuscuta epithymum]|uniref:RING-type E3 ubiquitin transferase n=1 Tax=Cuscuta epithymum TaxID=186058 RepID=A0AAV0D691_9ASTE|nr:unnamed protein product [Cuscuta epithymum]
MEEEAQSLRYWCYRCSRAVNPLREIGPLNCPVCEGGFLEEMETATGQADSGSITSEYPFDSERAALSLWAPILLGMMSNNPRRDRRHSTSSRLRHRIELLEEDHDDDEELDDHTTSEHNRDQTELDRELDTIIRRRRRRSSATILHLLQGIRAGMLSETENSEGDDRDRERVILINPFNQSIIVHGSNSSSNNNNDHSSLGDPPRHIGSLGDYFIGPGLDMLLQQLADNDPSRYGTPPARKEAVVAMPVVKVEDSLQCAVCLDDFEIGSEAKEMPCKHKFHSECIIPWLDLHSSCPVCRYQLPFDDGPNGPARNINNNNAAEINTTVIDGGGSGNDRDGVSGRQFSVPIPWPFSSLFSPSTSAAGSESSSNSANAGGPGAHTHED